ncbi:MAG: M20/M25/M40 family metallo-hydrolase [Sandaracinaceae bacterium]|nr:M20/M25/M40 family metallo-hydrolase [Sandaracinaceae bacterium]
MNRIQMYTSSTHLKHGLHRVLAVAHTLAHPLSPGESVAWWTMVEPDEQERARAHTLPTDVLARTYGAEDVRRALDAARATLGLPPLDHGAAQAAFRVAIISGKAHRAHMGRDVYGSSNKALWDLVCADFGRAVAERYGLTLGEAPVPRAESLPTGEALDVLRTLTAFDTSPDGDGHEACVAWLTARLSALGFTVNTVGQALGRPLLVAHRPAQGLAGHVVLYGHYDVTPFGREERWTHPPRALTEVDGRLFARGVADNKGPLACRLAAIASLPAAPELTWLIQGEEETGSPVAHALLPDVMRALRPTLWLDETGYHDHEDGTLRLLARTIGPADTSLPPDAALSELLLALRGLASRWGVGARHELRGLNKNVVEGGCPFNHSLAAGARYLAVGVNDSGARIHGLNESLPAWTFPLHADELDVIFRWVNRVVGNPS